MFKNCLKSNVWWQAYRSIESIPQSICMCIFQNCNYIYIFKNCLKSYVRRQAYMSIESIPQLLCICIFQNCNNREEPTMTMCVQTGYIILNMQCSPTRKKHYLKTNRLVLLDVVSEPFNSYWERRKYCTVSTIFNAQFCIIFYFFTNSIHALGINSY